MKEQIKAIFDTYDIKVTSARFSILEVLKNTPTPLNYDQIKEKMSIKMDKATFYRNIAKFESSGMVQKFESHDRKWYFELTTSIHAHFICDECHQIQCIDVAMGEVEGDVKSIVLKGTCKECKA